MSDESLFREVDEEVRREQAKKIWDRYGTYLVAVSLAVIVGVAGLKGWQYWQLNRSQAAAEVYFSQGPRSRRPARQRSSTGLAHSGPAGYALLARLSLAGALAKAGKREEAVKAYDAIAADPLGAAGLARRARPSAPLIFWSTRPARPTFRRACAALDKPESTGAMRFTRFSRSRPGARAITDADRQRQRDRRRSPGAAGSCGSAPRCWRDWCSRCSRSSREERSMISQDRDRGCPGAGSRRMLRAAGICSSRSPARRTNLPGTRESVLQSNSPLDKAKARAATDPIAIPAAVDNANWAQPGGVLPMPCTISISAPR